MSAAAAQIVTTAIIARKTEPGTNANACTGRVTMAVTLLPEGFTFWYYPIFYNSACGGIAEAQVFAALEFLSKRHSVIFPSREDFASRIQIDVRTVTACFRRLVVRGLLKLSGDSYRNIQGYTVHPPVQASTTSTKVHRSEPSPSITTCADLPRPVQKCTDDLCTFAPAYKEEKEDLKEVKQSIDREPTKRTLSKPAPQSIDFQFLIGKALRETAPLVDEPLNEGGHDRRAIEVAARCGCRDGRQIAAALEKIRKRMDRPTAAGRAETWAYIWKALGQQLSPSGEIEKKHAGRESGAHSDVEAPGMVVGGLPLPPKWSYANPAPTATIYRDDDAPSPQIGEPRRGRSSGPVSTSQIIREMGTQLIPEPDATARPTGPERHSHDEDAAQLPCPVCKAPTKWRYRLDPLCETCGRKHLPPECYAASEGLQPEGPANMP